MTTSADWRFPRWIAHRGAGRHAPENTLAAFRVGAEHGYRAFECDVKLSRDGVPFLLHDATLERTTSGRGRAADCDWDELSRLDAGSWHSPRFAGEPPASLAAVTTYCQQNGFALNLEIKPTPASETQTGQAVAEHVLRLWQGQSTPMLLSSFQVAALEAAATAAPGVMRALLLDQLRAGWQDDAARLGCAAVVFNHALVDAALMQQCARGGWKVLVYTVNDPAPAVRVGELGVDGLITDAVERFPPGLG